MIGDRGDGSAVLGADLGVLGVGVGQAGRVVENIGHERVDGVLRNVVARKDDCADRNGHGVGIQTIDVLADGDLGVVRALGKKLIDMLVIERDEVNVLGGGKVGNGGRRSTGHDKGRVDLAVLQRVRAVAEGLVGRVEHVHRIEEHAGTGRADGDVLALEIRNGLDLGIRGDDLHLLGVEGRDGGEALNGAGVGEDVRAFIGIGHDVGLAEGQIGVAVFKLKDVRLRAVADQADDVDAGVVGRMLGNDGAEGVIGAGLAAGHEAELGAGSGGCVGGSGSLGRGSARSHAQNENSREKQCKDLFHQNSLHTNFIHLTIQPRNEFFKIAACEI